jgi:hypothetical protein
MTMPKLVSDTFCDQHHNDAYETYRCLRDAAPVSCSMQRAFCTFGGHAAVASVFKDFDTYASSGGVTGSRRVAMTSTSGVENVPVRVRRCKPVGCQGGAE